MKQILFLIIFLLSVWGSIIQASDDIIEVMDLVVADVNEYLLIPIDLTDKTTDWTWEVVTGGDIAEDCRGRVGSLLSITEVFYDIHIYRVNEHYHYRVSMDEQLFIPCVALSTVPQGVQPQLIDALSDLNRHLHLQLTHNDVPWTWAERQFADYSLSCDDEPVLDSRYDRRTNGYVIKLTVQGEIWEYHVSSDRLIVKLCASDKQ